MARMKSKSRAARWADAAAELRTAVDAVEAAMADAEAAAQALAEVKEEYEGWLDNMPDGLRYSPTGEKLQAVVELDCEPGDDLDALRALADEAENVDLPLGWGKD